MTVLKIVTYQYPDGPNNSILRKKATPVTTFDDALAKTVEDMFETHYAQKNCAGLAANQLALPQHITVIDFSEEKKSPLCIINGNITSKSDVITHTAEGCMSVPGVSARVRRAEKITLSYQDVHGEQHELQADGFLAKCIQHELDHLDGVLFFDHLSALQQRMLMQRYLRCQRKR